MEIWDDIKDYIERWSIERIRRRMDGLLGARMETFTREYFTQNSFLVWEKMRDGMSNDIAQAAKFVESRPYIKKVKVRILIEECHE